MFLLAFWTSVKRLTKSVTGHCFVSYSMMQLILGLYDCWLSGTVISKLVSVGMIGSRHTARRGIVTVVFARYVRYLLACVASSGIGCNVGGMFINILAYADDVTHRFVIPQIH